MDKKEFVKSMKVIQRAIEAEDKVGALLGIEIGNCELADTLIDTALAAIADAVGDEGLPMELDEWDVMEYCGYNLPLVIWYVWDTNCGAIHDSYTNCPTLKVGGVVWAIEDYEDLYDVIQQIKEWRRHGKN